MQPKRSPLPPEQQVSKAIAALRTQQRRHLEALAEIEEALQQLGDGSTAEDGSAEDPQFREALAEANRTYGAVLRRLA